MVNILHVQRVWKGFWVRKTLREELHRLRVAAINAITSKLMSMAVLNAIVAVIARRVKASIKIQALARRFLTRIGYYHMCMLHARAKAIQRTWTSFRM